MPRKWAPIALAADGVIDNQSTLIVVLLVLVLIVGVSFPGGQSLRALATSMRTGKVGLAAWMIKVVGWDGFLPAGVATIPFVVDLLFPNNRVAMSIAAVYTSLAAFCARGYIGGNQIFSNNCNEQIRSLQWSMLMVGMFVLLFIDAGICIAHMDSLEPIIATPGTRVAAIIIVVIYFVSMTIVTYPGPAGTIDEQDG